MNFFKSILTEPDPEFASPPLETKADTEPAGSAPSQPDAPAAAAAGGWGFGGLLKTLTSQSETVLETYRRDLAEFSTGLRRETEVLREAAARAARDLPSSAHALDGLADIVAQGKDALSQVAAAAAVSSSAPHSDGGESEPSSAPGRVRYSRFEAQLRALQADPATFTADPEDAEDFAAWSKEFSLDERKEEIEALCYESDALEAMADRLVPDTVESEVFWARYFYRVHKLKQQEDARAKLVKRVIAQEEEEDLSWEVDDEDEEEQQKEDPKELPARQELIKQETKHEDEKEDEGQLEGHKVEAVEEVPALHKEQKNAEEEEKRGLKKEKDDVDESQPMVLGSSLVIVDEKEKEEPSKSNVEELADKKEGAKHETSDSSKDSDYSIVSRQRSTVEDEDLEWDEIEDLGEHEEKKGTTQESSPAQKEELRKRLSVAEDDEDLSWDIEDD
ncbi:hypothetical protein PR202_gb21865 [Eleusine coracana subsp. coracana]|uniref:BSD domain-containing protein n=1 Tax=Eleusine coracana subsp. coracana TaxID=191504 RepID=A0AAV5FC54_ELECO|nr:hypothetical protein QOZ80_7BG0610880 [Eleusine coracana subsp. coracana]GJN33284.1 hypothetical protein PR202_gb21865 [Eleusine coracana subsp. coracana]